MMADVWAEAWRDRLRALPDVAQVTLRIVKNTDAEHLSCILCGHGHEDSRDPPEWLVTYLTQSERICKGLHEQCRLKNASKP
jgi:hypothetical protein